MNKIGMFVVVVAFAATVAQAQTTGANIVAILKLMQWVENYHLLL